MTEALVDSFGRVHRDLRISVTDRCNFRCSYCMPAEGMAYVDRSDLLSYEEIERLAAVFVERLGFDSIRITGGEPLVRARLSSLVTGLATLGVDLALTTNGSTLAAHARELAEAGLGRINVSLDTLDRQRFIELTRRDELSAVLDGIDAALEAGLRPVKLNAVVIRGVNDDEVVDLARFGRTRGVTTRFIEFMPLDASGDWSNHSVVPCSEIVDAVSSEFPVESRSRVGDPAEVYRYLDGRGEFGVIASVTDAFCDSCDRVRLTAEGRLRACLFAHTEVDLRALLRDGCDDGVLAEAIRSCVGDKWAGHQINNVQFIRPARSMSQIGG